MTRDAPEVLDKAALLARLQGDTAALRVLSDLFLADCPTRLLAIRNAIASGDSASLARAAHSLKGAVAIFTNGPAHSAAARLEHLGRQNDLEAARPAYDRLDRELASLKMALEALVASA